MFQHFKHSQFRRYIVSFGSLFSRLVVVRDTNGITQELPVPLEWGPKETWLYRLTQDPDISRGVSQILPRMSFEITNVSYDSSRKLNTLNQLKFATVEQARLAREYVGVPYTLTFELSVMTKLQQDGLQIVEQIFPYFTPDLTFAVQPVPELGIIDQIPLTLQSVTHTDNYEGDFVKRRAIVWSLGFSMKVFFYGPRKTQSRIEEVLVDIHHVPFTLALDPPEVLEGEAPSIDGLLTEDEETLVTEATSNAYTLLSPKTHIHVTGNVETGESTTTITELEP